MNNNLPMLATADVKHARKYVSAKAARNRKAWVRKVAKAADRRAAKAMAAEETPRYTRRVTAWDIS